jgi:predicted kinase
MLTVTIMQGVPGAGKSYVAHRWRLASPETVVVSADGYPGLYVYDQGPGKPPTYDRALQGKAHGWCFRRAWEALAQGASIIVDNTNLSALEIAPYILMAQAFEAAPRIVRVPCQPDRAWARNVHGLPADIHEKMVRAMMDFAPAPWWEYIPGFQMLEAPGDYLPSD